MPKDLTKLPLRELDDLGSTDPRQRLQWRNGTLELTIRDMGSSDGYDGLDD